MRRCPRCGDPWEIYHLRQTRCRCCEREIEQIIAADAKRRSPRFAAAKDLSGQVHAA